MVRHEKTQLVLYINHGRLHAMQFWIVNWLGGEMFHCVHAAAAATGFL